MHVWGHWRWQHWALDRHELNGSDNTTQLCHCFVHVSGTQGCNVSCGHHWEEVVCVLLLHLCLFIPGNTFIHSSNLHSCQKKKYKKLVSYKIYWSQLNIFWKRHTYSGLKNRCNVLGFGTGCDATLDSVEISLSIGGMEWSTPSWLSNSTLFIRFEWAVVEICSFYSGQLIATVFELLTWKMKSQWNQPIAGSIWSYKQIYVLE